MQRPGRKQTFIKHTFHFIHTTIFSGEGLLPCLCRHRNLFNTMQALSGGASILVHHPRCWFHILESFLMAAYLGSQDTTGNLKGTRNYAVEISEHTTVRWWHVQQHLLRVAGASTERRDCWGLSTSTSLLLLDGDKNGQGHRLWRGSCSLNQMHALILNPAWT
jgi:hypothetical protein